MSIEDNRALCRRFYDEVYNQRNLDALDGFLAPDHIDHSLPPGVPQGTAGLKQLLGMYLSAFPDLRLTVNDMIAEGDEVAARWTVDGTHQGELMGIPPSGKRITVTGMDINRITDGRFAEHWGEVDMLGLMQQIDAIPASPQSTG